MARSSKWEAQHALYIEKHGLQELLEAPWSATHSLSGVPEQPSREQSLIDICYALHLKKASAGSNTLFAKPLTGLMVDISQSVSWEPWTQFRVRSITSGSRFYSYDADEVLAPAHHFAFLGWAEPPKFQGLSKGAAFELAAEAMSQPCVAAVAVSLATALASRG